ncbi:Anti-sigma regulatory factor (Ser/Thr protein kinase) [Lentzea xinjiangensis]|uniref:Anti-sigma regulatory factor (Ser/Thr protein kinase) n=2 Tax=Lentzea xinjiangensis TaxID=402600 RepID=A0A1H9TT22_9PSEU|nr:Anti-sigma regulatory factor (Ser/Thr protein kinase) [Lentzea xinjiangensis]
MAVAGVVKTARREAALMVRNGRFGVKQGIMRVSAGWAGWGAGAALPPFHEDVRHVHRTSDTDDGPITSFLQFTRDAGQAAAARRWTRETLRDVSDDELDDILLVVTELVSNAVDHGTSPYVLRLCQSAELCHVRVEVDDASADMPVLDSSRLGGDRGRGMVIINRLAKDWGVSPGLEGKTVWAEITCEPRFPSA